MLQVSPINYRNTTFKSANYNAVKIQINDPQTNLPEGLKQNELNNGLYNAVNVEVNRPVVNVVPTTYSYPQNNTPVTAEYANINSIEKPQIPVIPTYETSENLYQEEIDQGILDQKKNEPVEITNDEINFQAKTEPEVFMQSVELTQNTILKNLNSKNYDIQAQQMEEIARIAMTSPEKAANYVTTNIFDELINITLADTSNLEPPSNEQIEIRRKIIINELVKEKAKSENKTLEEKDLPYSIKKEEIQIASKLSPMEQAERNKEYSLYTMAVLAKVYIDETQKETGNIVPLTDLPGVSVIVDTLRNNENPSIKIAAIDSLRYIKRNEYNNELNSIFEIASMDKNPQVARVAIEALNN